MPMAGKKANLSQHGKSTKEIEMDGYTLWKPDDTTKPAIEWNPQASRRSGRPAYSWKRQLEKETAVHRMSWGQLKSLATYRRQSKEFVVAL